MVLIVNRLEYKANRIVLLIIATATTINSKATIKNKNTNCLKPKFT